MIGKFGHLADGGGERFQWSLLLIRETVEITLIAQNNRGKSAFREGGGGHVQWGKDRPDVSVPRSTA